MNGNKPLFGIVLAAIGILTASAMPKLELDEILSSDDFDDGTVRRAGNPQIISADVSPGLLVQTAQGVYRTRGTVDLVPATSCKLPADGKYLTSSVRLYAFGREQRLKGRLETVFSTPSGSFGVEIRHCPDKPDLVCETPDGRKLPIPYLILPVDVAFSAAATVAWQVKVTSLSDSSVRTMDGTNAFFVVATADLTRRVSLVAPEGAAAEVTVDNLILAVSRPARKNTDDYAFRAAEAPTFDPVKAGWKLMFADEFDGTNYDERVWSIPNRIRHLSFVSNGIASVQCDYQPGTTNLMSGYIASHAFFGYGYFESRVKFTTYNGWWSAVWLYSTACGNPFIDGLEIDIYEDYYMRNPARNTLDHNLHAKGAGPFKSWNHSTKITGSHKDWYTIGCLWTPFEISYYLDGKLLKSSSGGGPYQSATFDAFRHATTIKPLRIIFGGKPFKAAAYGKHPFDPTEKMPEALEIDWIRAYRWPGSEQGASPTVALRKAGAARYSVAPGEMLTFTADVKTAAKTGAKLKAVHLFDDGYHLLTKTEPPYVFTFPLTDEFLSTTAWKRSGRAKEDHPFEGSLHAFAAFAEDEAGGIGHSDATVLMLTPRKPSKPFEGQAQKIPGKILVGRYDEGGPGVAYVDSSKANTLANYGWRKDESVDATKNEIGSIDSGEWVNYTVDVEKTGRYACDLLMGSPYKLNHSVNLIVDGRLAGTMTFNGHQWEDWRAVTHVKTDVDLPAGRHILTLQFFGLFNIGNLTVTPK